MFAADPTRDLDALSTLRAVVVDGRLISTEEIEGAIARYREYFDGWPYDLTTSIGFRLFAR